MRCPVCNSDKISVVDSRPSDDGMSIRRRRECDKCNFRFSTIEEVELLDLMVVKRDGARESYAREKMQKGIKMSLTKRSYTQENFHHLIQAIERDLQKKKIREISSKEIGEIIMRHLRSFDTVAYIRFASVYRDFKDVKTFAKELKVLTKIRNNTCLPVPKGRL